MQVRLYLVAFIYLFFANSDTAFCQQQSDSLQHLSKKKRDFYITRLDTLIHVQSWISKNDLEYTIVYSKDFKLILAPNATNNLSFGFTYRYVDLGLSFSPHFLNAGQDESKKGKTTQFALGTGFSIHRFKINLDWSTVNGFYLKNSLDFHRSTLPDSPYVVFPALAVGYFSVLVRYNVNPIFSTAALAGGTQIQRHSAWTVLPSLQFATYNFHNDLQTPGVQNENTYSTDLNLLLPVVGTLVFSPKFSGSLGVGPSFGVDFFKSVSLNDSSKVVLSKGTKPTTGYSFQTSISYHSKKFFAGFETRYRSYGHKIEDISRLTKQYSYYQLFFGWRLAAPRFAKRSLDWVNKVSPVNFD